MYELIQVSEQSYYIQSPAKIGLVKLNKQDVCLIDSGNDKDAGRKVRQLLEANGWRLTAIYNTHSNADHIGGNKYLQGQTGCMIYAPGIDCAFTHHPILEPSFLYGGYPCKELRHKFLMAQESDAQELTKESLPEGFEIIPLPGHFFDMVGFRTPDDVVYLADCLSSRETLDKYQIGFIYDVAAYLNTMEMVKSLRAKMFPFSPKLWGIVSIGSAGSSQYCAQGSNVVVGKPTGTVYFNPGGISSNLEQAMSWSGNTVRWYNTSREWYQLNALGATYYYFAFS